MLPMFPLVLISLSPRYPPGPTGVFPSCDPHPTSLPRQDPFGQQILAAALPTEGEESVSDELNAPEYSTDEFRMFQFKVRAAVEHACFVPLAMPGGQGAMAHAQS